MLNFRRIIFVVLSSTLLFGTMYSVANHTYLDTSDPFVALGQVRHPLHDTSYFARKKNLLNTVFIKRAWGWTTAAFLAIWVTGPSPRRNPGLSFTSISTRERLSKWAAATLVWLVFATWFFGPALIERITLLSGGECLVKLPSGRVHSVPVSFCHERAIVSPATHPDLFFISPLLLDEALFADWRTLPRLMRGHDVSGHIFLLTMSLLFLADMIQPSLGIPARLRSKLHNMVLVGAAALMAIWVFAIFTTSVYFHTPFEKLTGYVLGLAGYLFTQLPLFQERSK